MSQLSVADYVDEYFYYYIDGRMKFGDEKPTPPMDLVWYSQNLGTCDEEIVCMWLMELIESIAIIIKNRKLDEEINQNPLEYNNRRKDEAFANEVLDDVAEQLAKLLEDLKKEKDSFKDMGIDYEEKAFYDILNIVARKYEFEYPDDKMIELSKRIKLIVDDKARYTDWSTRDDIKANLQVDLILLLDEFDYPPVTIDDVYKEVLEQAENFKKYAN